MSTVVYQTALFLELTLNLPKKWYLYISLIFNVLPFYSSDIYLSNLKEKTNSKCSLRNALLIAPHPSYSCSCCAKFHKFSSRQIGKIAKSQMYTSLSRSCRCPPTPCLLQFGCQKFLNVCFFFFAFTLAETLHYTKHFRKYQKPSSSLVYIPLLFVELFTIEVCKNKKKKMKNNARKKWVFKKREKSKRAALRLAVWLASGGQAAKS